MDDDALLQLLDAAPAANPAKAQRDQQQAPGSGSGGDAGAPGIALCGAEGRPGPARGGGA
jgi:hypothetical protein